MDWENVIKESEIKIINCLKDLEKGYVMRKKAISENTGIPIDILTLLLKRLKLDGKVEIMVSWSEYDCCPDGSGYVLTEK